MTADPSQDTAPLLLLPDRQVFRDRFNTAPFLIAHRLTDHPLFRLPRLIELGRTLPAELVEYNAGNVPLDLDPALTPRTGLSVEDTIRQIETCGSWMVLQRIERDPDYGALLQRCLAELRPLTEPIVPGMTHGQAYVFISSPGSVTPYHMDPEYNFLLQIRGEKQVSVLDGADRSVLSERELEDFLSGGNRNLRLRDGLAAKATRLALSPGTGLHIPLTAPHWVQNGPAVSISFSVTFRSPASDRRSMVYTANAALRRAGLNPTPYASAPWRDATKVFAIRALRRLRRQVPS